MRTLIFTIFCFFYYQSFGQVCTTLGQTPATAFPVCGSSVFNQTNVPNCTNKTIKTFCTDNGSYSDQSPFWYRFTCYQSGTLGLLITPNNLNDDYDWVLYDITNRNPGDVYDSTNFIVTYNFSGNSSLESARGYTGITGTKPGETNNFVCASNPKELGYNPPYYDASTFCQMPPILVGHTYLLMVSHFSGSTQSGYSLNFTGGDAVITDPTIPIYLTASGICGGDKVYIKLNKQIKCSSIAANGSDFKITPAVVSITGASGYSCLTSFDTDSIIVQLNNPLSANTYTVFQQLGNDANTLLDNCSNPVALNENKSFTITDQQLIKAAFFDSIHYGCKYDTVELKVTGRNIVDWTWYFDGIAKKGYANDTAAYYIYYGQHSVKLVAQNSVCVDSASINFNLLNAPLKSSFSVPDFACPSDTIQFIDNSIGRIKNWNWDFSNGQKSNLQIPPVQIYPTGSSIMYYPIRLTVTDSIGCSDTTYRAIQVAPNCYIAVPSAFTPNGDGLNDYLYPLNAYKATDLLFRVYNRFGQMIFETKDWTAKWDGTYKSIPQASGTYVWSLEFTEPNTHKRIAQKGTTVLIR
jgi:gliding motility-associated-like protein